MENMIKKIRKNKNKLEPYLLRWQLSILKRDQMKTIREDKELSEDERYIDTLPSSPIEAEENK